MVRGLDLLRERMKPHEGSIVLIGGAACDDWFSRQSLQFRATQDLDIVLIVELLGAEAVNTLRRFIRDGQYETRARSNGKPELYRFADPKDPRFPKELELFSRGPENIDLAPGETLPVITDEDYHSLSAILLDDRYYELIRVHHDIHDGLHFANATSLIPLKAFAWLDLKRRKAEGEKIDSQKIKKHRADVFRLAATLPAEPGPELAEEIRKDLGRFMQAIPPDSTDWQGILAAVKGTVGVNLPSTALRDAIFSYFRLTD
jgi:hypothetical protein